MKTWLEYINEEAAKWGMTIEEMVDVNGQFFHYRVAVHGKPILMQEGELGALGFRDRAAVEAFILGVWWARSGA